jgi:hypothetical protein
MAAAMLESKLRDYLLKARMALPKSHLTAKKKGGSRPLDGAE